MITYIIPSYNQGEFIAHSIESVINIMDDADQLIIQDALSSDNTSEVVARYLDDPRIEFYSEKDRGFSDGMRKALKNVRHEIIGIQSSDDAYLPVQSLRETVLSAFEDETVVGIYGDYLQIDQYGNRIGKRVHGKGEKDDFFTLDIILPQSSFFFRKSVLDHKDILKMEYDYVADVVLFNQIAESGKIKYVKQFWSEVRIQPGCRTGKKNPGTQYLSALENNEFRTLDVKLSIKSKLAAKLLESRYLASSGYRGKAAINLFKIIFKNHNMIKNQLFIITIRYIFLGPNLVSLIKKFLFQSKFVIRLKGIIK